LFKVKIFSFQKLAFFFKIFEMPQVLTLSFCLSRKAKEKMDFNTMNTSAVGKKN